MVLPFYKNMEIKIKQQLAKYWFSILQDIICLEVENLEKEFAKKQSKVLSRKISVDSYA